ncbi:TonB-dependent receptor, partial [Pseudomonas sp. GP01-A4]
MYKSSISLFALAVASVAAPPAFADTKPDSSVAMSAAPAPADPAPDTSAPEQSDIIVTGTRRTGTTAAESATPIKVLSSDELSRVGQPNLN